MDTAPVTARMLGLVRVVRHLKPDVICLQELNEQSFNVISNALCKPCSPKQSSSQKTDGVPKAACPLRLGESNLENESTPQPQSQLQYNMHCDPEWPTTLPYFCAMLTRKNLFHGDVKSNAIRFPTSDMLRGYIHVNAMLKNNDSTENGHKVSLVTSHLESLQSGAVKRKEQLAEILELQRDMVAKGHITVFAGDTNLREAEVPAKQIQKPQKAGSTRSTKRARLEPKFQDAWVLNGMVDKHKFTWDTSINDNLEGFVDFKPKARYDRAFVLGPDDVNLLVPSFMLVGKHRLPCGKYISDHWGLMFATSFEN